MANNIKIIGNIINTSTVNRYSEADVNLLTSRRLQEDFGAKEDYIECFVFDAGNNLLNTNFGNNNSSESLKTYYNANYINEYILKDLSKNKNHGEIIACEIIDSTTDEYKEIYTPVRRPSRFSSLKHEDNGFIGNMWKDQNTRWNQLRFINEVSNDKSLLYNDGLSDLEFIEYGIYKEGNITTINVGI